MNTNCDGKTALERRSSMIDEWMSTKGGGYRGVLQRKCIAVFGHY
jgi:hypothetical protein